MTSAFDEFQEEYNIEFSGADPDESKQVCADEIRDCELFIGIYARRYGFIPEGDEKSITEQELNLAQELGKPCFCHIDFA